MKTKQLFLSAHRDYGQVWYTLTSLEIGALTGHMPIGVVDMPMDEEKVLKDLDAFYKEARAVKRAALQAQITELDNQEDAA